MSHLRHIQDVISSLVRTKYLRGQEEHGGRLWRKPVIRHAMEEVTDLVVYMVTWITIQHPELVLELRSAMEADDLATAHRHAERALNIIEIGNADGTKEVEHEDGD